MNWLRGDCLYPREIPQPGKYPGIPDTTNGEHPTYRPCVYPNYDYAKNARSWGMSQAIADECQSQVRGNGYRAQLPSRKVGT